MDDKELDLLELEILKRFDGFYNGLIFGNFVLVRDIGLGDINKYIVNGKTFTLPINRTTINVTDVINNDKYTIYEKAETIFLSLVWYIRKEIEKVIVNHNLQASLKDFQFSIKVIFDGGSHINEKEGVYSLITKFGCGIIHDKVEFFELNKTEDI